MKEIGLTVVLTMGIRTDAPPDTCPPGHMPSRTNAASDKRPPRTGAPQDKCPPSGKVGRHICIE